PHPLPRAHPHPCARSPSPLCALTLTLALTLTPSLELTLTLPRAPSPSRSPQREGHSLLPRLPLAFSPIAPSPPSAPNANEGAFSWSFDNGDLLPLVRVRDARRRTPPPSFHHGSFTTHTSTHDPLALNARWGRASPRASFT